MTAQPHAVHFRRAIERRALWLAEDAARGLPNLPARGSASVSPRLREHRSPKYEKATLRPVSTLVKLPAREDHQVDETPALCVDHNRRASKQLGLRLEPRHERIARTTVDVYPRETETPCEALEDRRGNLHVELHRGRVGMHLQDGHLASGAIEIHLIHEDVGLVGLDEGDQLVDSRLDLLELPVEDERRIEDDDEYRTPVRTLRPDGRLAGSRAGRRPRAVLWSPSRAGNGSARDLFKGESAPAPSSG